MLGYLTSETLATSLWTENERTTDALSSALDEGFQPSMLFHEDSECDVDTSVPVEHWKPTHREPLSSCFTVFPSATLQAHCILLMAMIFSFYDSEDFLTWWKMKLVHMCTVLKQFIKNRYKYEY